MSALRRRPSRPSTGRSSTRSRWPPTGPSTATPRNPPNPAVAARRDGAARPDPRPVTVIVMGVAGAGKSTLLAELGRRLGWRTLEGDALHSPASVAKMAAGIGLTDADRRPWLAAIATWIAGTAAAGEPSIVACSALRRAYRDRLRAAGRDVRFVSLGVSREVLARRLAGRPDHFVPLSLLDSQLATLEPLALDEPGIELDATLAPAILADIVVARLAGGAAAPDGGDDADRAGRAAGAGHRAGLESDRRDPG